MKQNPKKGTHFFIHSFSSLKNPSSKPLFFCVSILSPTTTNQKVLQSLWPKVDLHKILNFRYTIRFVVVAMMFCSPATWTNGCIVKLQRYSILLRNNKYLIQEFFFTSVRGTTIWSSLLVKMKGIDVKYSRGLVI